MYLLFGLLVLLITVSSATPPHVIVIMLDDLGISNVGFSARLIKQKHAPTTPYFEADYHGFTPNIDALAGKGIVFTRHYAYSSCTGSRQSFLSGRLPTHVGIQLGHPESWDGGVNPENGYDGLSPNITTMHAMMQKLGYVTHLIGKMDGLGMATPHHFAQGRGINTTLGFFHHANDGYDYSVGPLSIGELPPCDTLEASSGKKVKDFWFEDQGNVIGNTGKKSTYYNCTTPNTPGAGTESLCTFEDLVFTQRAVDIIKSHATKGVNEGRAMFMYFATHLPHTPLQAPADVIAKIQQLCGSGTSPYPNLCTLPERQQYLAMVSVLDGMVKTITDQLTASKLYDNTVILFVSDNGGPEGIYTGGNAFPFRGGKGADFDGGFRVPAFVSGGYVEKTISNKKNTTYSQVVHMMDWYATFCSLAGGSLCTGSGADPSGDLAGMRPVDSVNILPFLTKAVLNNITKPPPHETLQLSPAALLTTINNKLYKLVAGTVGFDLRTSPTYPNCTYSLTIAKLVLECNTSAGNYCCPKNRMRPKNPAPIGPKPLEYHCAQGCLFDIENDETELNDICESNKVLCDEAIRILVNLNGTNYEPFHGCQLKAETCKVFENQWNFTYGPFINVDNCPNCIYTTQTYLNSATAIPRTKNECQCQRTESACNKTEECVWNVTTGCDYTFPFNTFTLPQIMAYHRFENHTKGEGED